ncbi:MAG: glycosyl hydrolase family 28-related protein [Pseudomonadota bacterium]
MTFPSQVLSRRRFMRSLVLKGCAVSLAGLPFPGAADEKASAIAPSRTGGQPTGAQPSSLNKPSSYLSVRALGAKGDGQTDDNLPLQEGIDRVSAAGGGTLFIPSGVYLTGQLALRANVRITGEGYPSCLRLRPAGNNYVLANTDGYRYVDNVTIDNLRIDGNKHQNRSSGGIVMNGRNFVITQCTVHDTVQACIECGAPGKGAERTPLSSGIRVIANYCLNPGLNGNAWGAIGITHGSNVLVQDNVCETTDGQMSYGIDIEPNAGNLIDGVKVIGNILRGGRLYVDCENMSSPGRNIHVSQNQILAENALPTKFANAAAVFLRNIDGLTIESNLIVGHPASEWMGIMVASPITQFSLRSNKILGPAKGGTAKYGIFFGYRAGIATHGEITGNSIDGGAGLRYGIYAAHPRALSDVKIAENVFTSVEQPYALSGYPVQ